MAEMRLSGVPASGGIAIGRLILVAPVAPGAGGATIGLADALALTAGQLRALQAKQDRLGADIIEFQIALIEDDELTAGAFEAIKAGTDAVDAFGTAIDAHLDIYVQAESELFRSRAADVVDLRERVVGNLRGAAGPEVAAPVEGILLCPELTPSHFLEMDFAGITGIVTSGGSPASHVATLARARGLPYLAQLQADPATIEGREAVIDAEQGLLVVEPEEGTLAGYVRSAAAVALDRDAAASSASGLAVTAGGVTIPVHLNVDSVESLDRAPRDWFDGIGLARTELMLVRGGALIDEAAETVAYGKLFDWANGAPVTIRLLDAGGDKPIKGITAPGDSNPFLGVRGIRLLLRHPDLLRRQLRAILVAAAGRPVRILVPMVTLPAEFSATREMLEAAKSELAGGHRALLGPMVETPAFAWSVAEVEADFYSIGSNDLTQYVMAAARDDPGVAALQQAGHPAVLALVRRVADHARARGLEASLCGDAAADRDLLAAYLDAGISSVSVAPAAAPAVKAWIRARA